MVLEMKAGGVRQPCHRFSPNVHHSLHGTATNTDRIMCRFSRLSLLLEPGLVILAFAVLIAVVMGFSRMDLSLGGSSGGKGGQAGGADVPQASPREVFDQICSLLIGACSHSCSFRSSTWRGGRLLLVVQHQLQLLLGCRGLSGLPTSGTRCPKTHHRRLRNVDTASS